MAIIEMAKADAKIIEKYLKEKYKPGEFISKSMLAIKFNLPHNRSTLVFRVLEEKGFQNEHTFLIVPPLQPLVSKS